MELTIREIEAKYIKMSPVKVKRYFYDTIIDYSNTAAQPTNAHNCVKVYYKNYI
jgi:hypothetical protein